MRVSIDYTPALRQSAGIGRYTRGLIGALVHPPGPDEYTLFCAGAHLEPGDWGRNVTIRSIQVPDRWLALAWHRLHVPIPVEWLAGACDIFHSPDFALPPLRRARGIVTVHDLSFMRVPECADPRLRAYLERTVPRSVRRAVRVLADSISTRQDLIEMVGVPPEKISVVYAGVEPRFRPVCDLGMAASVRARYGLPERYILAVGTLEPRKNHGRLIEACARLWKCHRPVPDLVIAGGRGWLYDEVRTQASRLGVASRVRFAGFVDDADLPTLYTLADLFVFPSLYEGFGIPPLEAMACGTPVITSDNSSLPEAVGEAAIKVDALDVVGLSEAIARTMEDSELRKRLVLEGHKQAARFTWQAAAEDLRHAYHLAMA